MVVVVALLVLAVVIVRTVYWTTQINARQKRDEREKD